MLFVPKKAETLTVKGMELSGFEPLTFSMPLRRATNCAIAPLTWLHPRFALDCPKPVLRIALG